MQSATVKTFNYSSSVIAWNEGNGKFTIQELPLEVQLSSVNAVLCKDINNDGKLDIVLAEISQNVFLNSDDWMLTMGLY